MRPTMRTVALLGQKPAAGHVFIWSESKDEVKAQASEQRAAPRAQDSECAKAKVGASRVTKSLQRCLSATSIKAIAKPADPPSQKEEKTLESPSTADT